jgi:agmatine/peptidylarginine deiminase
MIFKMGVLVKSFLLIFFSLFSLNTFAAQGLALHGPTDAQIDAMALHNQNIARTQPVHSGLRSNILPFAEYTPTGYIVFNDDDYSGMAKNIKNQIAANLPAGVTLIVYTQSSDKSYQKSILNAYSKFLDASRIKVLQVNQSGANDFWSRDNLPIPVLDGGNLSLVDARYYYNFEPDAYIADLFGVNLDAHNYFYEGGNFMANSRGDCLMVNRKRNYPGGTSDTASIPDDIFKTKYGCKTITRFKHLKGIGHADEVVKFMSDDVVFTDTPEYKAILEQKGFTVYLLPEADRDFETYINSLIVNDTVFVPTFGESHDQQVMDTYKSLGFKVVGINTRALATGGQGGIHCLSMNYPVAPLKNIAHLLRAN